MLAELSGQIPGPEAVLPRRTPGCRRTPLCLDPMSVSAELDKGLSPEPLFPFVLRLGFFVFCIKSRPGQEGCKD